MNLRDSKQQVRTENMRARFEHNHPDGPFTPQFRHKRRLPCLHYLEDAYFYYQPLFDYYYFRFKKTIWTTVFSLMFLGFVYIMCFIDQS